MRAIGAQGPFPDAGGEAAPRRHQTPTMGPGRCRRGDLSQHIRMSRSESVSPPPTLTQNIHRTPPVRSSESACGKMPATQEIQVGRSDRWGLAATRNSIPPRSAATNPQCQWASGRQVGGGGVQGSF